MYTRIIQSQRFFNYTHPETIPVVFKNKFDNKTINKYIESLRGDGKSIAQFFMKFRSYSSAVIKNSTISKHVGCTERTVKRWTKRFVKDGFINKSQYDTYSVNTYQLGMSKSTSITYWCHNNPDKADLYNTHGIIDRGNGKISFQYETVTPYSSYIYNNIYITNTSLRARMREGKGFKKREEKYMKHPRFGADLAVKVKDCTTAEYIKSKEWKAKDKFEGSIEKEIMHLERDVITSEKILQNPSYYLSPFSIECSILCVKNTLDSNKKRLSILRGEVNDLKKERVHH